MVLALGFAAQGRAAVACTFAAGVLDIDVTTPSQSPGLRVNGSNIEVLDGGTAQPCIGSTPTVNNAVSIQAADDLDSGQNMDFLLDLTGGSFAPGTGGPSEGLGDPEIEITIDGGDNDADGDELTVIGTTGNDSWQFGALTANVSGANLNPSEPSADADDVGFTNIENLQAAGNPGDDTILANGPSTAFSGPLTLPGGDSPGIGLIGEQGDDELNAAADPTNLVGEDGDDTMTGGPGGDRLSLTDVSSQGNDVAAGGPGSDSCDYTNQGGNLTVDLRLTTAQSTGAGLDTLSSCENLVGGNEDDVLIGTNGPNTIFGDNASAPGNDTIFGLGGVDTVSGGFGVDSLQVRDGGPDTATCGPPNPGPPGDKVTADGNGVDTIAADCELISFPAAPPPPPPPSPDTDPPETSVDSGPKRKTRKRKATITFSSDEAGSSFECTLDGKPYAACASPFAKKVKRRRHSFLVRATDPAGNTDGSPAERVWKVKKKRN